MANGVLSNGTKLTRDKVAFITGVTGQVSVFLLHGVSARSVNLNSAAIS